MRVFPMKKMVHGMHLPSGHNMGLRINHIVHDERFWPIMIAAALLTLFIGLIIWVGITGEPGQDLTPTYPFLP